MNRNSKYSQSVINRRLSDAYKRKHVGNPNPICEGCGQAYADDNDHTISQRRCKEIGLPELIWNSQNIVSSCRQCHQEWENYKSGKWLDHINAPERMAFIKRYDMETYNKRLNFRLL